LHRMKASSFGSAAYKGVFFADIAGIHPESSLFWTVTRCRTLKPVTRSGSASSHLDYWLPFLMFCGLRGKSATLFENQHFFKRLVLTLNGWHPPARVAIRRTSMRNKTSLAHTPAHCTAAALPSGSLMCSRA